MLEMEAGSAITMIAQVLILLQVVVALAMVIFVIIIQVVLCVRCLNSRQILIMAMIQVLPMKYANTFRGHVLRPALLMAPHIKHAKEPANRENLCVQVQVFKHYL